MGKHIILVLLLTTMTLLFLDSTNGACCDCPFTIWVPGQRLPPRLCDDGTRCTPCCGYRPCNFFCCACECRTRSRSNLYGSNGASDGFQKMDQDGDGFVNKTEAISYISTGNCGNSTEKLANLEEMFEIHDNNGDNVLSYDEINSND